MTYRVSEDDVALSYCSRLEKSNSTNTSGAYIVSPSTKVASILVLSSELAIWTNTVPFFLKGVVSPFGTLGKKELYMLFVDMCSLFEVRIVSLRLSSFMEPTLWRFLKA